MPAVSATAGILALSRKIKDDRQKKLNDAYNLSVVGDANVTPTVCEGKDMRLLDTAPHDKELESRDIHSEVPYELDATTDSQDGGRQSDASAIYAIRANQGDVRESYGDLVSPLSPQAGPMSQSIQPIDDVISPLQPEQPLHNDMSSLRNPGRATVRSQDTTGKAQLPQADLESSSTSISTPTSTEDIRIPTNGEQLKSGFPYHPALFDLNIRPATWTAFTHQIIESSKLDMKDRAGAWAAACPIALTGFIGSSICIGRSVTKWKEEEKVKAGLEDSSDGQLGDVLRKWNAGYFVQRGLSAHMELSKSALKHSNRVGASFRRSTLLYSDAEERAKKRDERKFAIVITRLDTENRSPVVSYELESSNGVSSELGSADRTSIDRAELASTDQPERSELASTDHTSNSSFELAGDHEQATEHLVPSTETMATSISGVTLVDSSGYKPPDKMNMSGKRAFSWEV